MIRKLILLSALLLAQAATALPPIVTPPSAGGASATAALPIPYPTLVIMGDSTSKATGAYLNDSVVSRALMARPRALFYVPEQSGGAAAIWPGPRWTNFGIDGSSTPFGAAEIASIAASDPDIVMVMVGRNEGGTGSAATAANIDTAIAEIRAAQPTRGKLRFVFLVPTMPGTQAQSSTTPFVASQIQSLMAYKAALFALQRGNPIYHVIDFSGLSIDNSLAGYAPYGGCAGGAAATSTDCVHWSGVMAGQAAAIQLLNRALDIAGVDPLVIVPPSQNDIYDASACPSCNRVGAFGGSSLGVFNQGGGYSYSSNVTGTFPGGYRLRSSSATLNVVVSVGQPFTDQNGRPRIGAKYVITASAPLSGDQSFEMDDGGFGSVPAQLGASSFTPGKTYEYQAHIKRLGAASGGCAGLATIERTFRFYDAGAGQALDIGQDQKQVQITSNIVPSDLLDTTVEEDRDYHFFFPLPSTVVYNTSAWVVKFKSGSQPSSCTIYQADEAMRSIN